MGGDAAFRTAKVREKYLESLSEAADYLIRNTSESGYTPASADYVWYLPHWFRDSSWIATSLIRYADFLGCKTPGSAEALSAASRIISFNTRAIGRFASNIRSLDEITFENHDFFNLEHHMPSRVNPFGKFYADNRIDDTKEMHTEHSWLMQYDTIPLILYSLNEKQRLFGLGDSEILFLRDNARGIAEYMGKIYITECASAWEINQGMLHAYDVASIHMGFEALKNISKSHGIGITHSEIEKIANRVFAGGPDAFLRKFFVADGILYNERKPFAEGPLEGSLDASEIFAFLNFGASDVLGNEDIERNTIELMEKELFGGNMLPIRFMGDTYYKGGRWLLLGLAFAEYYIKRGETEKGRRIIDYVIGKYEGSYPEQEIVNTASETDMFGFYASNGYRPIQNLSWSYAALIMATIELLRADGRSALEHSRRK